MLKYLTLTILSVQNIFLGTILTFQTAHIKFSLCNRINWSFGNSKLIVLFTIFALVDFLKDFVWKLLTIFSFQSLYLKINVKDNIYQRVYFSTVRYAYEIQVSVFKIKPHFEFLWNQSYDHTMGGYTSSGFTSWEFYISHQLPFIFLQRLLRQAIWKESQTKSNSLDGVIHIMGEDEPQGNSKVELSSVVCFIYLIIWSFKDGYILIGPYRTRYYLVFGLSLSNAHFSQISDKITMIM